MLETAETTIYIYTPTETGVYTFTAPDGAILGYWGAGSWFLSNPNSTSNTYEWTCTGVGQSAYIGVSGADGSFTLNVAKTGDYTVVEIPIYTYENKAALSTFILPEDAVLGDYIDVTATTTHTAVLGNDGYYHLNGADGDIILVDMDYESIVLSDALNSERPVMYVYDTDEDGNTVKWDIGAAVQEYENYMDEDGYYPLTEDLIYFYDNYANGIALYTVHISGDYNEDNAWMYCMRTATFSVDTEPDETEPEETEPEEDALGSINNPDELLVDDYNWVLCIEENSDGYYFVWTAEEDGTLTIEMPEESQWCLDSLEGIGWSHVINNLTAGVYGEIQYSDSDSFVNTGTIKVSAGDQVQIIVNSYDPEAPENTPALEDGLEFYASFKDNTEPESLVDKWNLVLDDDLIVNFHLNISEDIASSAQVEITVGDSSYIYDVADMEKTEDGKYIASVHVAAAQMMDAITVQIVGSEDTSDSVTYTVRQYADTVLADDSLSQYHELLKEMLNYGAAAQTYFDNTANGLANDGIENVGTSDVPETADNDISITGNANGITFYGASLTYCSKVAVRLYFKAESDEGLTFTANGSECSAVEKDDYYMIEVSGITPENLDQQITVTVTDADGNVLTVSYGPMNYIVRMNTKGSEHLKALVKAMYNYHLAAKALRTESV